MGFQYILNQLCRGGMPDGHEHAFTRNFRDLSGFDVLHSHAFNAERAVGSDHLIQLVKP